MKHDKQQQEIVIYQELLTEIELWLHTVRETLLIETRDASALDAISDELKSKEYKLDELKSVCERFKQDPQLREFALTLEEQLRTILIIFAEHKVILSRKIENIKREQQLQQEVPPELSVKEELKVEESEDTLDSISMPIEETLQQGICIETQTGDSLLGTVPIEEEDMERKKESIKITKTVSGGMQTIHIATNPTEPIVQEPDDLTVAAN